MRSMMLLILVPVLLVGCKRAAEPEPVASASATASATASDEQVDETASFAAGQMQMQSGSNLSLPADFPKDVHVPANQSIQNVVKVGPTTSIVFGLESPAPTLMPDIETSMKAQDWKTTMSMLTGGEGSMIAFSKPDRSVIYTLTMHDGGAQLTLQHTQQGAQ